MDEVFSGQPGTPESAVRLKGQLLRIASALYPDRRPVVVREWTDPVRLRDPEPVGHRFLFLVCAGGDDRPSSPGFDDVLHAFTTEGWTTRRRSSDHPGESRAEARREDFEVRVYEGSGPGLLTFTGWTPVVYTGRQSGRPRFTLSTVPVPGVLCDDCHGWGVCLLCGGRAYSGGSGGYGRCVCAGNNAGPGRCVECGGSGALTAKATSWVRKRYGLPDPDGTGSFPQVPAEGGHDSGTSALVAVSERPCACGEVRCSWRNRLTDADDRTLALFAGTCQGCAAQRAYAFELPRRRLAADQVEDLP
ncbi:hypothetical protein Shyhy01_24540 [Streptomyces hygroscopicus subsp. hygroscopicus]|nr:hypothetical protein [Streptomyces hygroscopicus]GLX49504.1 hypothetical protein Shyhy01_24540 [Streptomyces hygroscopicus subsp. hygroscopicus]